MDSVVRIITTTPQLSSVNLLPVAAEGEGGTALELSKAPDTQHSVS